MPQEDDCGSQMEKALKVLRMIFISYHQPAEVEEPGEKPLYFPPAPVPAQWPPVLRGHTPVDFVGCDQLGTVLLHQLLVQPVAVVRLVPDQTLGHIRHEARFQRGRNQFHFSRRSAFCPQGERKTMAVGNTHDLGALAPRSFSHQSPPFLAGTNVPSTKHSLRSNPPASRRCSASTRSKRSITPERTQFWKRRCAVWYGPYRRGKSCHGAPVRKIHSAPLSTIRRSLQRRPRPSARTGPVGRMVSTIFHCSFVRSIHNYLYING